MFDLKIPTMPVPSSQSDAIRWDHTRLRRRMLYGGWISDLDARIRSAVGVERSEAWGYPDLSANVFRSAVSEQSTLYDRSVRPEGPAGFSTNDLFAKIIDEAGLWQLMQRVQRDTIGLREMLVKVEINYEGNPTFKPIFPDMVLASADPSEPDEPNRIANLCLKHGENGCFWAWEYYDISDRENPKWGVRSADWKTDLSERYITLGGLPVSGEVSGALYPFRYADGRPFIPMVLYHAQRSGELFDWAEMRELVEGALNVAVLWTYFGHVMKQASWPQRYTVGVMLPGTEIQKGEATRSQLPADPTAILNLIIDPDQSGTAMVGQFQVGADPAVIQQAIGNYERRVASFAGISASDVQREAGDPRSGFAISINKEAKRESQRRYMPQFMRGDTELLKKTAALLNLSSDATFATEWAINYEMVPVSVDEMRASRENAIELLNAGLISQEEAYIMVHPGSTKAEAQEFFSKSASTTTATLPPGAVITAVSDFVAKVNTGELTPDQARKTAVALGILSESQAYSIF